MINTPSSLLLRRTMPNEIASVMEIIASAQRWFALQGIDQWQNGYPNPAAISADIEQGNSYLLFSHQTVVATAAISFDGEPIYAHIDGAWKTNGAYTVVHRVAVKEEFKGQRLAVTLFKMIEQISLERAVKAIRVDTHPQNHPMQRVIQKLNFDYCGNVYVLNGALRWAYEKELSYYLHKEAN